jgi:hypothetical protein
MRPVLRTGRIAALAAAFLVFTISAQDASAQTCATVVGTRTGGTATIVIPDINGPNIQIIFSSGDNITFSTLTPGSIYGVGLTNGVVTRIIFVYTDPRTGIEYEGEINFGSDAELRITGTLTVTSKNGVVTTYNLAQPTIQVTAVMFNHKPQIAANDDALDIRTDFSTNLPFQRPTPPPAGNLPARNVGEWIIGRGNGDPALWLANKAVTIKARFSANTNAVTSADIAATAVNGLIPNVVSQTVNFARGVSANPTYVQFSLSRNTDNRISKAMDSWQWTVTNVNGCGGRPRNINRSGVHTLYTVLDTPTAPWYTTNAARNVGQNHEPWVTALEFAIARAGGNGIATVAAADAQFATFLHGGFGLSYDTRAGTARYMGSTNVVSTLLFNLTGYMAKNRTAIVNCQDQGAAVTTLTNLIGGNSQYRTMDVPPGRGPVSPGGPSNSGFGYIQTTALVGNIRTDNPGFASRTPPLPQIAGNKCLPMRTLFNNHAFSLLGANVYDATAGPHTGTENVMQYLASTLDTAGLACHAASAGQVTNNPATSNLKAAATLYLQ